jgi:hypothetical protein
MEFNDTSLGEAVLGFTIERCDIQSSTPAIGSIKLGEGVVLICLLSKGFTKN